VPDVDGHDSEAVNHAIVSAKAVADRPSIICCKTVIAKGAPTKAGTHESHGSPLGDKEIAATRAQLGWSYPPFVVPPHVYEAWDAREAGAFAEENWKTKLAQYRRAYPQEAQELERRLSGELPADFARRVQELLTRTREKAQTIATRKASQDIIEALAPGLPELLGGSADLAGSNLTMWSGSKSVPTARTDSASIGGGANAANGVQATAATQASTAGNYIHYGVREFGMSAIMNGIALHGGFIPYGGTFLTFSDYSRNALRMAALMRIRSIFVFTHDSIGLGEDGPTHQPVEHVAALRLIPNMDVWRPCDTEESAVAWAAALERRDGPSSLIFSRQNLPFQKRSGETAANIARGGYVLVESDKLPRAVIIATGSEVGLAVEAQKILATQHGISVRVVSMPSTSIFDRQPKSYRDSVLPPGIPSVAVEAGSIDLWWKYVGRAGAVVGMTTFGESAPAGELFKHFGFTAPRVVEAVKRLVK
jgi:transketolase